MFNLLLGCLSLTMISGSAIEVDGGGQYATYSRGVVCESAFSIPIYQQLTLQTTPNITFGSQGYLNGNLETYWNITYDYIGNNLSYYVEITSFTFTNLEMYLNLNHDSDFVQIPLSGNTIFFDIQDNSLLGLSNDEVENTLKDICINPGGISYDSVLGASPFFKICHYDNGSVREVIATQRNDIYIDPDDTYTYDEGKVFSFDTSLDDTGYKCYGFNEDSYKTLVNAMILDTSDWNYDTGYNNGYDYGYDIGYGNGHADGFNEGLTADGTAITIFNGILSIGMLPINVFLRILNFNILGVNLANFVTALLSVCIMLIIIRTILGTNKGD